MKRGIPPILVPRKSTDWDTKVDALGYTINAHTMRIPNTREKVEAIRNLLLREWESTRSHAGRQDVLKVAGELWNLTFVVRAGRYCVWQLLRLPGLLYTESRERKREERKW